MNNTFRFFVALLLRMTIYNRNGSAVSDDPLNHLIRLVPRHLLLEEKAKVSTNQAFSLRRRGTACGG